LPKLKNDAARAFLGLSHSGLLLRSERSDWKQRGLGRYDADWRMFKQYTTHLRTKATAQIDDSTENADTWADFAQEVIASESDFQLAYDQLKRMTRMSTVWKPSANAQAKLDDYRRCGTFEIWAAFSRALTMPGWPTAADIMTASGDVKNAAAYWFFMGTSNLDGSSLRVHFDRNQTKRTMRSSVWLAYGKERTQQELQRAADTITLKKRVALVQIFEHQFVLASGRNGFRDTDWYSLDEIKNQFRKSELYQVLTDSEHLR
jgi:hypothetical protein